jgi:hypothetical protein
VSYPALVSFAADGGRTHARWAVYMAVQPPVLSHALPRALKLEEICHLAKVRWATASETRAWLIAHGYLIEHGRDARGMPLVTLAWALEQTSPKAQHG